VLLDELAAIARAIGPVRRGIPRDVAHGRSSCSPPTSPRSSSRRASCSPGRDARRSPDRLAGVITRAGEPA
jgi:hypothetical protein